MTSWIIPYMQRMKGKMSFTILFGFLGVASGAMLLFISGYLISKSSLRPENVMLVYVPIVSVRAFSVGQAVFPYVEKLLSHQVVLSILAKYRRRLYNALEKEAISIQDRYETGDLLQVLSEDIERLQDLFIKTLFPSIVGLVIYVIIVIVVGLFDVVFMILFALLLGIIVFLLPYISLKRMKHIYIKENVEKNKLYREATDGIFGQLDWLVSGRFTELLDRWTKSDEQLLKEEKKRYKFNHIRDAFSRLVGGFLIVAMLIWTNHMVESDLIEPTLIAAFVLLMFSIIDALLPLSNAVENIPNYEERMKRLMDIESQTTEKSSDDIILNDNGPMDIVMNNISFRYEYNKRNTLDNIQLQIKQGEKLAILGKSGAGKSTLLKLFAGIIRPTEGEVLIQDEKMDSSFLSNYISVLNQKPHIFHTTIANNIKMAKKNVSELEIIKVLKQVNLYEYVQSLPKGIHTNVDELGKRLSGGQRQRLAFARVLIQGTPIIILDEATIGLDPKTERNILETFMQAAKDKTVIVVTHHLVVAPYVDRIIFLQDGKISMEGSHEQLLEQTYYKNLVALDYDM